MDTTRPGRPPRVRIESNGASGGTRVLIDGHDFTNLITSVSWHVGVGEGPAMATVTFLHVDIAAEAEFAYTPEDWEQLRQFAPNLVEAIENTKPVEGRAKIVPRGEPFTPVKLDPDTMAKLATGKGFEDVTGVDT
jgi:hypothetical protein